MPKATLTFTLPEEREEFETASKAGAMKVILWDLDQFLRGKLKYEDHPEEIDKVYQEVRDKLHDLLSEENVDL